MADYALPDLISRIKVDSSGVDSALLNLIQGFGKANLAMVGAAAGLGLVVIGAKSMIEISEKHTKATNDLAQAVGAYNASIGKAVPVTAEAAAAIVKAQDAQSKATDALTISHNAAIKAQLAYTDAVHAHGAKSEAAYKASLNLQDAQIRLKQAQDALTDSTDTLAAAQSSIGKKVVGTAINLQAYQAQVDDFIKTNRRYISDQAEVINGYAILTRSGLSQTEVQRVMNDAVDLAALKSISLTDAVTVLNAAEHGRMKGLIDLGITTTKFTDAQGNLVNASKDVSSAMGEVDSAVKNGRDTLSTYTQDMDALRIDWDNLAIKYGPGLIKELDNIVNDIDKNMPTWSTWLDKINNVANQLAAIPDLVNQAGVALHNKLTGTNPNQNSDQLSPQVRADWAAEALGMPAGTYRPPGTGAPYGFDPRTGYAWSHSQGYPGRMGDTAGPNISGIGTIVGKQYGGSVLPGGIYRVGEAGPETLVMGASGGTVIPNNRGGGGSPTIHFHQVMTDPWQISNELAWLKKTRRL